LLFLDLELSISGLKILVLELPLEVLIVWVGALVLSIKLLLVVVHEHLEILMPSLLEVNLLHN